MPSTQRSRFAADPLALTDLRKANEKRTFVKYAGFVNRGCKLSAQGTAQISMG